ncbi:Putative peptidase M4/M1, CTD superfamily, transcription initiation factor TFIID subunit 2 [Septoria linicola]|uniref:Transcription initiation factor TFIID subunit 2 n=1 Tax=Septoria linicola TaxID=215465 RepID=A0A9Q9ATB9_9PEZI|nr:Putative peptidase M4/M1, CTD superfamily, transcription initiation factor TFIID subunit 2 [Septoria linicola]
MPALGEDGAEAQVAAATEYSVLRQRVDLDIDFPNKSLKGSTEITIQPLVQDLRFINLHCRQCRPTQAQISGINAKFEYDDPFRGTRVSEKTTVHQHAMLKSRVADSLRPNPEHELVVTLPPRLKIQELRVDPATALPVYEQTPTVQKQEADALAVVETPVVEKLQQQIPQFAPIKLTIEFELDSDRDGIRWIGCDPGDQRYPYLYSKLDPLPGSTSSIFPCIDDATTKCTWEMAIRCPRTLGDAYRKPKADRTPQEDQMVNGDSEMTNGHVPSTKEEVKQEDEYLIDMDSSDAVMELTILCTGDQSEDVADPEDDSRHTVTYALGDAVTARHVGFAIGPFEHVDLTSFRASEEEAKLGQTAVRVDAYCLPGRVKEVENVCYPVCQAVDHIAVNCGRFPFSAYQLLFVDDMVHNTAGAAGLTICSARLLFPQDIIEPLDRHTRILIRAVAEQWSGVNIVAKEPADAWIISGIAGYLTDVFMKKLAGNNQYRWEQKVAAEKIYDLDVDRPSLAQQGDLLHLDPSIRDFLDLKSAVVLGILDRRLIKTSGSTGVLRIINKIFLNAKTGTLNNGELSTGDFQRICEKLGHNKLDTFFRQWVYNSGCPIFQVHQKFNKKKLVVEMTIVQRQLERKTKPAFEPSNFMREVKEHVQEVWAPEIQPVFTGPMTIRIHEADGTPYEHIVEIKEPITKLEIPYSTKYKRLKRSRRQKERADAADGNAADENGENALLYCLGDILDSKTELEEWKLTSWSPEDEESMKGDSYEWIRMDADFEWIGKIHLVMPLNMYISQLQQDRDIVAQYESMRYLLATQPHEVSLTILVRTLMDERYFHGIRVMAADGLATIAKDKKLRDLSKHQLMKAFQWFFCESGSGPGQVMPRPNDFSSRINFIMQCAIPQAMAKLRDDDGKVPIEVRDFFKALLTHNDNSDNVASDCHYVATLMTCLADALVVSKWDGGKKKTVAAAAEPEAPQSYTFEFGEEEEDVGMTDAGGPVMDPLDFEEESVDPDAAFTKSAVDVIERYRRLDEWVVTYQNIYSTTAIECLQKLVKAGVVKDKVVELMQYTRHSTADNVRLQAFRCMNEIGLTRKPAFMKHMLYSLSDDPSPYFRERMIRLFGEALGHIALSDSEADKPAPPPANDGGLILEEAQSNETRRIEATRKTTPEGAIAALKISLEKDATFKQALWYAATSPMTTLDEVASFCDVADLIFDAVTSLVLTIKYPSPWKVKHTGKGKMRFYSDRTRYLTKPAKSIGLSWDAYQDLETHGLQYNGPLSEETVKALKDRDESKALKIKISQLQREQRERDSMEATMALQQQATYTMPPPAPPASIPPTPTEQKSGFKLSLGGIKRKASVDISAASRESSPKVIKSSKASTPGSAPKSATGARRGSISGKITSGKVVKKSGPTVILPLSISGSRRASDILSRPPTPGRLPSTQPPARKIVPTKNGVPSRQNSVAAPTTGKSWSPGPASLTSPGPNMNLGGFRSFGDAASQPVASISPPSLTTFRSLSNAEPNPPQTTPGSGFRNLSGEAQSASPPKTASPHPHAHPASPGVQSLTGGGVTSLSSLGTDAKMDPPKKKFTLKLGVKPKAEPPG